MLKIIKRRKIWFTISGVLVVASIVLLIVYGLNLGIDFKGGSLMEIKFNQEAPDKEEIEGLLSESQIMDYKVQPAQDGTFILRMEDLSEESHQSLLESFKEKYHEMEGNFEELRFESIGPTIGQELREKAIYAILLVLICIVLYIAYAFRKVSTKIPSYRFGVCAIIALFHDILILLGIFVLLGKFWDVQLDSLFVIALLTVLGYSVNDTIVVFDRIRFNLLRTDNTRLNETVDLSLNQTLTRSLNTSLTTLLVLVALYLFGGSTIQWFVLALIIGVITGTYSSIFVASPILVAWEKFRKK
jgi:preprotein translocase subunit SecF